MVSGFAVVQCGQVMTDSRINGYPRLEHGADIRGPGRIGEDCILEIARCQAAADCQREDVDHLVNIRSDEVCAEDVVSLFLDEHLEAVDGLGDAPSRVPV
jgi:hypothetical protein